MNTEQSIPLLYRGQAGNYFGTEYESSSENVHPSVLEIGQLLAKQGLVYLGKLTCSQSPKIEIYAYVSQDKRTAISVMSQESGLQGIDCVCRFTDNSYLTTTTVKVIQNAYEEQGLFRVSLPGSSVSELITQHLAYVEDFEKRCGEALSMFEDLLTIAQMVDEYTIRQEANFGHGLVQFTSGLAATGMAQMMEDDTDGEDEEAVSPLEKLGDAAMYGKLAKVQQLIAEGADANAITECGKSPLMLAAMYGHKDVIETLLDAGADPNLGSEEEFEEGTTALMCIASSFFASNRAEVIKFLVNRGANPNARNENGETAMIVACNNADAVKALIEAGADVNIRDNEGNTAMMLADWTVQQLLRQAGASEEGLNDIALVEAASEGDLDKVKQLLQAGANINYGDGSALVEASATGNLEIVNFLIEAGADVNLGWKTGCTPIADAAYQGHFAVVERLLAVGANPFQRTHDEEFDDALDYARRGQAEENYEDRDYAAIIELLSRQKD